MVESNSNFYKFKTEGEHKVRINIDLKNSSSLEKFFSNITELISVSFTNDFNTSNIENLDEMFASCSNLNYINSKYFNIENVTTMKNMFNSCTKLSSIKNAYTLMNTKVESISGMFSGCSRLQTINLENILLENTIDISSMFSECKSITNIRLGESNTKNVLNMSSLFQDCYSLNYVNIKFFNTENVIDMSNMFKNCEKLTSIDVSTFKTDKVENMFGMFQNVGVRNLDLSHFETKNTRNMGNMFYHCYNLYNLQQNFNTKNVENMSNMFGHCNSLKSLTITNFNLEKCNNVEGIFDGIDYMSLTFDSIKCKKLIEEIPDSFNIKNIPSKPVIGEIRCVYEVSLSNNEIKILGDEYEKKTEVEIYLGNSTYKKFSKEKKVENINLYGIPIQNVYFTFKIYEDINMDYMFKNVPGIISIEMESKNNCKILSMISTFEYSKKASDWDDPSPRISQITIKGFSVDKLKSMHKLLYSRPFGTISFDFFDTISLEDISYMFAETTIDKFPLKITTSNVKNMSHLFENCQYLSSFTSEGFDTSNAIDMSDMFYNCDYLTNLNLSLFKTDKVQNMFGMFQYCSSLESLDLSNFNTENVVNMDNMFYSCISLTSLDISSFNIEKCNYFNDMFTNDEVLQLYIDKSKCQKLIDIIPGYVIINDTGSSIIN